ncbi:CCR4-NOT transcription complex subunit 3 [Armadillidium nasatum]|uniref:CCR4-NOT transcription complex subunit 3 n=1 Tax=Armadillidium nasatum TaxID=96803 RepID=A0A5N5SI94_9CRUS|nr:CCR4-NOT transcription complex subunit 3 [Armadillidium nasatum]
MAASRKLQGEIDRCLKKVAEGVEQFEDIWKKVHNATNSNQKEKYEADLKKEIKKLQRLRDQIKSWLQSGEIKDKTQLLENRKLIETQMERFKVVERETKTKAYSKEGLGAAQNKDPAQREREEVNKWLSESIDTLNIQVDQFESEIESLMAAGKKKKIDKEKSDRVEDLRDFLDKHRYHIKKLEILMRMLNNESVDCDQIKKIKDDVEYYIESSQDPDYVENDGVYDEIDMEDLDYPTPEITVGKHVIGSHESTDGSTPSSSVCGSSPAPSPAGTTSVTATTTTTTITTSHNNHSTSATSCGDQETSHTQATANSSSSNTSSSSSSHHERKRSGKSDDSRSGSTPLKPQVVRPTNNNSNFNSSSSNSLPNHSSTVGNKATPSPSTPSKPVSGSISQSTPNNSSSSSGLMNHINNSPQLNNRESSLCNSSSTLMHNSINSSHTLNNLSSGSISSTSDLHSNTNGPTNCGMSNSSNNSGSIISSNSSNSSTSSGSLSALSASTSSSGGPLVNAVVGNNNTVTSTSLGNPGLIGGGKSESGVSLKAMAQKKLNEVNTTSSSSIVGHERSSGNLASSITSSSSNVTLSSSSAGNLNSMIINSSSGGNNNNNNNNQSSNSNNSSNNNSTSNTANLREKPVNATTTEAHIPPLLGVAPLGPVHLNAEHKMQYERLQASFFHMPHPSDSERFRLHFPRQPCQTPSYYPQVFPDTAPLLLSDTVDFFQRLSTETLFFIFYYMEGTKAQYLAAKALKKQSWRFHTKYMMWFQRHEEPKAITDEFEQGTYIFFDYENWGQRKRENFIFEYRFLEDRDLN